MIEKSIYREPLIKRNNFPADDVDLQVNCTGVTRYEFPLHVKSCRKDYYLVFVRNDVLYIDTPVNGQSIIEKNGFIIFEKNIEFAYHGNASMEYKWIHFGGQKAKSLLTACKIQTNTPYQIDELKCPDNLFDALFDLFIIRDDFFDIESCHKLSEILISFGKAAYYTAPQEISMYQIKDALLYINENYMKQITITELAELEYMCVSHFRAQFSKMMRMSPQEYIISIRIRHACEYLTKTNLPISMISSAVGYDDSHYFSRIFQLKMGVSPKTYRQSRTLH